MSRVPGTYGNMTKEPVPSSETAFADCCYFDGYSSLLVPSSNANSLTTHCSMLAWIRSNHINGDCKIFSKCEVNDSHQCGFSLDTHKRTLRFMGSSASCMVSDSSGPINALPHTKTTWMHVACTFSPTALTFYLNGRVLSRNQDIKGPLVPCKKHHLCIGIPSEGEANFGSYEGEMAQLSLWDCELTEAQVGHFMQNGNELFLHCIDMKQKNNNIQQQLDNKPSSEEIKEKEETASNVNESISSQLYDHLVLYLPMIGPSGGPIQDFSKYNSKVFPLGEPRLLSSNSCPATDCFVWKPHLNRYYSQPDKTMVKTMLKLANRESCILHVLPLDILSIIFQFACGS